MSLSDNHLQNNFEPADKALHGIFNADSVAVVGVSNDPNKLGYMTLDSIIKGGFRGRIYPVNPKGGVILGLSTYPSLLEIPDELDLAVIIVPANHVPGVMRDAARKNVKGAVILSAGFREAGRQELEDEVLAIARQAGIRFVGPNVQGINYLPNRLCAMFFPVITTRGPLAVVTQSGSATAALSEWAAQEGLGVSAAINLGNQTDLFESDYLDFFADDPSTKTIALYLEGVRDGRRFLESLERATAKKPVAVLKSGRSDAGRRAVSSHTGALAGSQYVFEAACRQAGAITAENLEDLFDRAKGLAAIKPPAGNRVLSISTSGGMSALAADGAEAEGLALPSLPEAFICELRDRGLAPLANMSNPLDLGYLPVEVFREAVLLADRMDFVDIILLNFGDPMPGAANAAVELAEVCKASLVVNYLGGGDQEKEDRICIQRAGLAVFPTPDRAMKGIGAAFQAADNVRRKYPAERYSWMLPSVPAQKNDLTVRYVTEPEALSRMAAYQLPYPDHSLARTADQAVEIAENIGYPVVLKLVSIDIPHKSEAGGVITGLYHADDVRASFDLIRKRVTGYAPQAVVDGILVCKEKHPGLEAILGATRDPVFGPTVMFGLGGVFAEIMRDVSFRIAPLTREDAKTMIREIRGYPLLAGARGSAKCDLTALRELLVNVSRIITENPDIMELDLNPVRLYPDGLSVLDVRLISKGPFTGSD